MLLQVPERVERRCPRWWSLAVVGGLLALAVLIAGVSFLVLFGKVRLPSERRALESTVHIP